eukprot:Colp12_sorted_trinity150504_noHs@30746
MEVEMAPTMSLARENTDVSVCSDESDDFQAFFDFTSTGSWPATSWTPLSPPPSGNSSPKRETDSAETCDLPSFNFMKTEEESDISTFWCSSLRSNSIEDDDFDLSRTDSSDASLPVFELSTEHVPLLDIFSESLNTDLLGGSVTSLFGGSSDATSKPVAEEDEDEDVDVVTVTEDDSKVNLAQGLKRKAEEESESSAKRQCVEAETFSLLPSVSMFDSPFTPEVETPLMSPMTSLSFSGSEVSDIFPSVPASKPHFSARAEIKDISSMSSEEAKRTIHNVLERRRRNDLKDSFTILRDHIPCDGDRQQKANTQVLILRRAAEYIMELRRHEADVDAEKRRLLAEHDALAQRLRSLQAAKAARA